MIILTAEQADKVRGISPTHKFAALNPVPLKDGTYMLPEEVLDDLAHIDVRLFLLTLPKASVSKALMYGTSSLEDPVKASQEAEEFNARMKDASQVRKTITTDVVGTE